MKQTALYIGLFLLLAPSLVLAQAIPSCSAQGYTIVFVNGVFDTRTQADADKLALQKSFGPQYNNQPVTFQLGYNPTHLAGAGDILQSLAQQFNSSVTDFDLDTILMQIYPEVTTRKLLVVGHSQGASYANSMYSYLLAHGEPKQAVGVYAVATPASFVAGDGTYITSSTDKVIGTITTAAAVALQNGVHLSQPLPANITLVLSPADQASVIGGHSFTDDYLGQASTQIINDISGELGALVPTNASPTGDCFTPPDASVGYKAQQMGFAVADPTATVLKVGVATTYQASTFALGTVATLAEGAYQFVADAFTLASNPPSDAQATAKTNTIVNKLYGSSLDGLSAQDKKDLLGQSQGGAVALAVTQPKTPVTSGVVLGTSTSFDTIQNQDVATSTAPTSTPSFPQNIFPSSSNGPVFGGGGSPAPLASVSVADESVVDTNLTDGDDLSVASSSTDDIASSTADTDESQNTSSSDASSTSVDLPPTGAPVVDNFDTYSADPSLSTWSVIPTPYNTVILFGADDGTADTFTSEILHGNDCHSGGCIIAAGAAGGLGSFGYESFMYKESGVGQDAGAFTIWARARAGWREASANVGLCAGVSLGCASPNNYWFNPVAPNDNVWHQYYIAWRQGSTAVESCLLQDDTNSNDCVWRPIVSDLPLGTQFDGILLAGGVVRPDLGDQVWFDDLADAPNQ